MKVKYDSHQNPKMCCGLKNQHRATARYTFVGLPHIIAGCGKNKKEAQENLLKSINELGEAYKKAFEETVK